MKAVCIAALVVASAVSACGAREAGLSGEVVTEDGRSDLECLVRINSEKDPFYAPELVIVKPGHGFFYPYSGPLEFDDVFVEVVCDGYRTEKVDGLRLRPGTHTSAGRIVMERLPEQQ